MTVRYNTNLLPEDLPLSSVFIDFIARWLDGASFEGERWHDQLSEELSGSQAEMRSKARRRLERLVSEQTAQNAMIEVYGYFYDLAKTAEYTIKHVRDRYQFIAIVGIPRTGGSYITAELFSALGYDPTAVPAAIAHDGFPNALPTFMAEPHNAWTATLLGMSEYLVMLDRYFPAGPQAHETVIIPKKLTKGVYAGSFFNVVLGDQAEYLITIRHPIACCISTYEKSGGLPSNGRFTSRSAIERWVRRDLVCTGVPASDVLSMEYFTAYCRYWEQFYIKLALSGLTSGRKMRIVPYGAQSLEETARSLHSRFNSRKEVSTFLSARHLHKRHPDWIGRSEEAMERVASVWRLLGFVFPSVELAECC